MQGGAGMGMMGPIGLGLQVAGALTGAEASRQAGKFQQKVDEANAVQALADGEAEASTIRDEVRRARGEQLAAQGASGFEVGTGSALTALRESLIAGELDIAERRRAALGTARAYRARGAMARYEGRNRGMAQLFGAAASVAASAHDWASAPAQFGYRSGGRG